MLLPCVFFCLIAPAASETPTTQTYVLYDGSLGEGNQTLQEQGFRYAYFPFPPFGVNLATQSAVDGVTTLDSSVRINDQAGYFTSFPFFPFLPFGGRHPDMPRKLDRMAGVTVEFSARIAHENHRVRDDNGDGRDDRGGFSIIVVTSDLYGIEIAFWEDEVWAYNDDRSAAAEIFTHGEGTSDFDPTADLTNYSLRIQGDVYELFADDRLVLTGPLRNYENAVAPVINPYVTPNLIVLSDDTMSAGATVEIGYVAVTVPEPSTLVLLAAGLLVFRRSGTR